jgi:hypothetical protein
MARTKVYGDRVRRSFYFEPAVVQALEDEADKRAISVNLLVNRAAIEWIERQRAYRNLATDSAEWEPEPAATTTQVTANGWGSGSREPKTPKQVEPRFKKNK